MADKGQNKQKAGQSAETTGLVSPNKPSCSQKGTQVAKVAIIQATDQKPTPLASSSSLVSVENNQTELSPSNVDSSTLAAKQISTDTASQLRSTLALGQLIASNRPTAGSKLIANELKNLSNTVRDESAILRKEIANLSSNIATTLKTALEEERDHRGATFRRNAFGQFPFRRFPVYGRGRGRGIPLQFARKSLTSNASTNTPAPDQTNEPAASTSTANVTSTSPNHHSPIDLRSLANKQTSIQMARKSSILPGSTVFKNPWLPSDRSSYDGEADTESTDTSPSTTP